MFKLGRPVVFSLSSLHTPTIESSFDAPFRWEYVGALGLRQGDNNLVTEFNNSTKVQNAKQAQPRVNT